MSGGVGSVSEYATSVVRLFSGWADSAVWFSGPVDYQDTRLNGELVADLRSWDNSYYAALTADYDWRSPELATHYCRTGARLARRLARQMGDDFQVEHDLGHTQHRVRAAGPADNPEAAAAFHEMADRARAERSDLRDIVTRTQREGDVLCWSADWPVPRHSPSPAPD